MADKPTIPSGNEKPDDDAEIERRVRDMMDVNPAPEETSPAEQPETTTPEPATAPELHTKRVNELPLEPASVPEPIKPEPPLADDPLAIEPAPPEPDKTTDDLIDDITKSESDDVLSSEDEAVQNAFVMKPKIWERLKNALADLWGNPRKRYGTIIAIIVLLAGLMVWPLTRYFVLNTVGVRSQASITVLDNTTNQPLKNVTVTLGGQTGKTDVDGKAHLTHVKLGKQTLVVDKLAFAKYTQSVTVGLGGLTLNDVELKAVGTQFTFSLTDYVSGQPVAGAQVTSGESSALADKTGKAVLTVQPSDKPTLTVLVAADGYRTDNLTIDATSKTSVAVKMVIKTKEVFVSRQSGKYDLTSVDLDGKNRQVLLAGSGLESAQSLALSVSPDGSQAAFVSTRDNQHDADGFLLSTLTIVNIQTGAPQTVDHGEVISLLGWSGSRLVYQKNIAAASAANANRERIYSYDTASSKSVQLANANGFNGVKLIGSNVYYAISATDPAVPASFNKIGVDGTGKQQIGKLEVRSLFRSSYSVFTLQLPTGWSSYTIGDSATRTSAAPSSYDSRVYLDNADGSVSLWVDTQSNKPTLLQYDIKTAKDTTVTSQSNLTAAVRWLDKQTIVYRVNGRSETADYVLSLVPGSQPKKIVDVTNTALPY